MNREKLALPKDAAPQKSTGDDVSLSLALPQLVYRHDRDEATLVKRAKELKRLLLEPES